MPTPQRTKETRRIQFAYYAYINDALGDVFSYLLRSRAHSTQEGKKMGIRAISAFWKPFSAHSVLNLNEQEVKLIARTSIEELEKQIELIRTTFGIETPAKQASQLTQTDIENIVDSCVRRLSHQSETSSF